MNIETKRIKGDWYVHMIPTKSGFSNMKFENFEMHSFAKFSAKTDSKSKQKWVRTEKDSFLKT